MGAAQMGASMTDAHAPGATTLVARYRLDVRAGGTWHKLATLALDQLNAVLTACSMLGHIGAGSIEWRIVADDWPEPVLCKWTQADLWRPGEPEEGL